MNTLERTFRQLAPAVDFCAMRYMAETTEQLTVRQDVIEAPHTSIDRGVMVTVMDGGGLGYAATSDLTSGGIRTAIGRARDLARLTAGRSVIDHALIEMPRPDGTYRNPPRQAADRLSLAERMELTAEACRRIRTDPRIVDWTAELSHTRATHLYVTADGGRVEQVFDYLVPSLSATAHADGETQSRSSAGRYNGFCQQGGLEVLEHARFLDDGRRIADEALQLLAAPNCPSGHMDVLLMPDQMMLQIHESIGHPLELDRILGDERNFAGTSFVTLDMFGSYRYGSDLLDVTFDPGRKEQFASYAFDDDGAAAERTFLIRRGVLERPLGGTISQARARALRPDIGGVANARACSWNRPPIDRMANLNIEPGDSTLEELVAGIEDGVMMQTNASWSIDDSRNKFQFGCEFGRRIRGGRLAEVVKNPNYRGISATFWRALTGVGDASTLEVMGTPFCGKGEPSQVIRVGHASPACRFSSVDVFGGAE